MIDAGGAIVEILGANFGLPPSKNDLDAWIDGPGLPVTSVRDPDSLPLQSMNALQRREIAYIVDLRTMKIVQKILGSTSGAPPDSITTAVQQVLVLIGPTSG